MNANTRKLSDVVTTPVVEAGAAPECQGTPEYRTPARFPVGEAVELLRRDGSGHLRDGTGGWYVWGS
jgi:hypothetical protein